MDKMLMRSRIDVLNYMNSQLYHIMSVIPHTTNTNQTLCGITDIMWYN